MPTKAKKTTAKKTTAKKTATKKATASKTVSKPKNKKIMTLPDGYKPTEKEEYMCDKQLEYFRQKLLTWRDELAQELGETLEHLKEENWQEADIADRATVETDASIELRTRDRYRKVIKKIDDALDRIEQNEYGYCEESGEEIGLKRLEARPIATLTIEAQERHERDERTHYDEDLEERA